MSRGWSRSTLDAGTLVLDAIDVLDGTPVIDIKPYFASINSDRPDGDRCSAGRTAR